MHRQLWYKSKCHVIASVQLSSTPTHSAESTASLQQSMQAKKKLDMETHAAWPTWLGYDAKCGALVTSEHGNAVHRTGKKSYKTCYTQCFTGMAPTLRCGPVSCFYLANSESIGLANRSPFAFNFYLKRGFSF